MLSVQCLDRRIPDKPTLIEEVAAWENERNRNHIKADWQFTTADARIKLKRLYPVECSPPHTPAKSWLSEKLLLDQDSARHIQHLLQFGSEFADLIAQENAVSAHVR